MSDWVTVGQILHARGNRGEVLVESLSGVPGRFKQLTAVNVGREGEPGRTLTIEDAWEYRGLWVVKFAGVDSISDAEELSRSEIRISAAERAVLPEDEFYHDDIIGCMLVEKESGREVGRVTGWREFGGPALLVVKREGGEEALVPFAKSICVDIRPAEKRILVELPEGLLDVNP